MHLDGRRNGEPASAVPGCAPRRLVLAYPNSQGSYWSADNEDAQVARRLF